MYISKTNNLNTMKMKTAHPTSFTSVHVFADRYATFKQLGIANGMTLQKLLNRCIHLYINDPEFKKKIDEEHALQISGSAF